MLVKPTTNHGYVLNEQQNDIPLPSCTAFKYRTSDTSAAYVSKLSASEISDFYSHLAENGTFLKEEKNNTVNLFFKYYGESFEVEILKDGNNSNFTVDVAD